MAALRNRAWVHWFTKDQSTPAAAPDPAPAFTRRELGWAILGLALAVTLFLSPALLTGRWLSAADLLFGFYPWHAQAPAGWTVAQNGTLSDTVLAFEPWLTYAARRLHEGSLPLWNPQDMLGAPFLANMQSAVFFPANWPYLIWPTGAMFVVCAWLKLFSAAIGMYLLARQALRVGPTGATIAALSFAFGASMTVWLLYSLANAMLLLPWLWWATARLLAQPSGLRFAALSVIVGLTLFAGHPETAYHLALVTGLFALFCLWNQGPLRAGAFMRGLGVWSAAYLLGTVLAAIQVLPFLEYVQQSAALIGRANPAFQGFWLPGKYAWTMVSPDLFGNPVSNTWWDPNMNYNEGNNYNGVLLLLLAPLALAAQDRHRRRLTLFLIVLLLLTAGVVYHWPVVYPAVTALPLMRFGANQRLVLVIGFALGLLAALGVQALVEAGAGARRRLAVSLLITTLALPALGVGVPWLFAHTGFQVPSHAPALEIWQTGLIRAAALILAGSLILAGVLVFRRLRPRLAFGMLGLLPLLLFADLWQAHSSYNPTISPPNYFPATPLTDFLKQQTGIFRTICVGGVLLPNTNLAYHLAYGVDDLGGYDAVGPQLYANLVRQIDPQSSGGGLITFMTAQSPLLNMLNVRYALAPPGIDLSTRNVLDAHQETISGPVVGKIQGRNQPGQTFVAEHDNITAIQVFGGTYGRAGGGRLIFHLKSDPTATVDLVTQVLDAAQLQGDSYWAITFPPIPQAQGRRFYFYLEAPAARPDQAVTVSYSPADLYPAGTRVAADRPATGDLVFRVLAAPPAGSPFYDGMQAGPPGTTGIFENTRALPRAWLAHRAEVEPDEQRRLNRLSDPEFDPAGTVLLAAPLPAAATLPGGAGIPAGDSVTITEYAPEAVDIQTHSSASGVLILADQAFPGWEVTVDGSAAPILTVDYTLRGVYLAPGEHRVRFAYQPWSFRLGAALTGLGMLILLALGRWRASGANQAPDNALESRR